MTRPPDPPSTPEPPPSPPETAAPEPGLPPAAPETAAQGPGLLPAAPETAAPEPGLLLSHEERRALAREFRKHTLERFVADATKADQAGRLDRPERRALAREFRMLPDKDKQSAVEYLRRKGSPSLVKFAQVALNARLDGEEGVKSLRLFMAEVRRYIKAGKVTSLQQRDAVREFAKLSAEDKEAAVRLLEKECPVLGKRLQRRLDAPPPVRTLLG
jgi:hypothetical protein